MTEHYEITYITTEDADPGVVAAIEAIGGRLSTQRSLGRRQFAYPIKKETAGYYTTARFTMEPSGLAELTKRLNLMAGLLRSLVVSVPATTFTASLEVADIKEAKELGGDETPATAAAATPVEPTTEEAPEDVKAREDKLQAQLDKLLTDDQNEVK
ncbi:30S ribosomal protein S6 [Candidatus Berkelbacteria bacterium]|nr:30S ribosomal protein S6 [Candidatus Berkelbacteria bacterium]